MLKTILLHTLLLVVMNSHAQRGSNSLYSYYGIGDIQLSEANGFSGMANASIALRGRHGLNDSNPASYTGLYRRQFTMELALGGHSTSYVTSTGTQKGSDFTFQSLAVAFNAGPKYTTAFSLKPFSRVDYQVAGQRQYAGLADKVEEQLQGSGGVYQAAWSNAFAINKRQSFGISTGFLFGSINSRQDVFGSSTSNTAELIVEKNRFLRQFFWKVGAISEYPLGKSRLALGITYQPSVSLVSTEEIFLKDASENILYQETEKTGRFEFPTVAAAGVSLSGKRNVFSVNYSSQLWGNSYNGANFTSNNSSRVAIGYMHKKMQRYFTSEVEGVVYQAGGYFEHSYLQIHGNKIRQYGFTAGMSVPNRSHSLRYNVFIDVGQRGTAAYPLVKEKFFKFGVAINFKSFMMDPRIKYD